MMKKMSQENYVDFMNNVQLSKIMDLGEVAVRWDSRCGITIAGIDVAGLVGTSE
jgi:hypothetical protein